MHRSPKPDTATATFVDGPLTVRLSFPAEDAALWRRATQAEILAHLGLAEPLEAPMEAEGDLAEGTPFGTDDGPDYEVG